MSTKSQTSKNLQLVDKLLGYLSSGENIPSLPHDVSFVPFSKTDKKLNTANGKIIELLTKEEKPVAIAEEPKTNKENWKIIPVNF